jgi:hypothetical protein
MTDPAAVATADPPHEDHVAPTPRRRSVPLWAGVLSGLAAAAVVIVAVTIGNDPPAVDHATTPVVVDGLDPVRLDGATVTTPCFSYRVPAELTLDRESAGCATVVGFGQDRLTQIVVVARTSDGTDFDEDVAELRRGLSRTGEVAVDPLTLEGREAVRIRNVDGWGVRRTSYLVSLPAGRFTQNGRALTGILLTSPAGPEFDDWMATILDSLTISGA